MRDRRLPLTITGAVLVLLGTSTALLLFDSRVTSADALRTGGFAAGSVVALYALWLNDRRRKVAEQRKDLENRRTDVESERASDERFARAIELLGSEADQVRVGALHALAGLARNRSAYAQTVLDVICSYLRRPFVHPRYGDQEWSDEERNTAERELQARLTAQRLLYDLLPPAHDSDAPAYDLDLTGASVEYFDLSGCRIGTLTMRYASFRSSTNLSDCEFTGPVWFTGSVIGPGRLQGRFRCQDALFRERGWFSGVHFHGPAAFDRTRFKGLVKFGDSTFEKELSMQGTVFDMDTDFDAVTYARQEVAVNASFGQ